VFEVAGSIAEFYERAADIGLEYLADDERAFEADEDFQVKDKPEETVSGRAYLAMPNVEALRQLLSLWNRYTAGQRMPDGFGMWTQLFGLLKDVRAWGPADRLQPDTIQAWRERIQEAPGQPVRVEAELWFRENPENRANAFAALTHVAAELGGRSIQHAVIPEVRYDAALIELPAASVEQLIAEPTISLARLDEIMYIRPQTMAEFPASEESEPEERRYQGEAPAQLAPIAALLDGLPIQNHDRLANRLSIDDPDGFEEGYVLAARKHGTEMASLILHGDINRGERALARPIYVRPVMRPVQTLDGWDERTPADQLLIDLIYRAVRRMKEGEGDTPPTAPSVVLINLSLGDPHRPFSGSMSPWARLLDYLAFKYRILFLVSAGNVTERLALPQFASWGAFEAATAQERELAVFQAVNQNKAYRTILSPAEAINVIAVGAAHNDAAVPGVIPMGLDPIARSDLPNVSSALGLGFRRVIKPDILADGGREYVRFKGDNPHLHIEPARLSGRAFGLLAAANDPAGLDRSRVGLTWGTSAATALATRAGHLVYDALMDRDGGSFLADTPAEYHALIVKALLVHSSNWRQASEGLDDIIEGQAYAKKDGITRFLGHGVLDVTKVAECSAERATLIGFGNLRAGTAALYGFPLPPGLEGVRDFRAVTLTVAWFSPLNFRHQGYRMIAMEAGPGGDAGFSLAVERSGAQPHHHAIRRGTVFHDRREGQRATAFVDGGQLLTRLSARSTAGEYTEPVPYAIAISVEVGVGSAVAVYDPIRAAVAPRVRPVVGR
jgi:hypothetical protein